MLSTREIDEAASLLVDIRRQNKIIDCIPQDIRPLSLDDAYAAPRDVSVMSGRLRQMCISDITWSQNTNLLEIWIQGCTNG